MKIYTATDIVLTCIFARQRSPILKNMLRFPDISRTWRSQACDSFSEWRKLSQITR